MEVILFESDIIIINIPSDGISVQKGWIIQPSASPIVRHNYA